MLPADEPRSPLLRLRTSNAELAHTVIEGCAVYSQPSGLPGGTTNHPTRFAKYAKDVVAFDGFECGRTVPVI